MKSVEGALAGVGGSLESFYFAFGDDDVILIVDVPDHAAAIAMAGAVATSGAISSYETVVLLSPSDVDKALNVAVDYRPPGSCSTGLLAGAPGRTWASYVSAFSLTAMAASDTLGKRIDTHSE